MSMSKSKLALIVAACLSITATAAVAGPGNTKGQEGAERQQAREHSKEAQRFKQRDQEHAQERREQAEKDKAKVKEHAEQEEGLDNNLEDDGVDGTE